MPKFRSLFLVFLLCCRIVAASSEFEGPAPEPPACAPIEEEKLAKKMAAYFQSYCSDPTMIWRSLKAELPNYTIEAQNPGEAKCGGTWNVKAHCKQEGEPPIQLSSAFYCEKLRSGFSCVPDPTPVLKPFAEEDIPTNYPSLKECLAKPDELTACATRIVMQQPAESGCDLLGQTVRATSVLVDACYQALAAKREQEIFCDRIHRERPRRECFVKVAWAKQNPALCRRLHSDAELMAKCTSLGFELPTGKSQSEKDAFFHAKTAAELVSYVLSTREEARQAVLPSLKSLAEDKKKEVTELVFKAMGSEPADKQLYATRSLPSLAGKENVGLLEAALAKLASPNVEIRQAALESVIAYKAAIEPRHFDGLLTPLSWGAVGLEKIRPVLLSQLKSPKSEKDMWEAIQKRKGANLRAPSEQLEDDLFTLNPYLGSLLPLESSEELTEKAHLHGINDAEVVEQLKKSAPLLAFNKPPRVYEVTSARAISLGELFKKKLGDLDQAYWIGVQIEELTLQDGYPLVKVTFPYAEQNCRKKFETAKAEGKIVGAAYVPLYDWETKLNFAVAEEDASCNPPSPAPVKGKRPAPARKGRAASE